MKGLWWIIAVIIVNALLAAAAKRAKAKAELMKGLAPQPAQAAPARVPPRAPPIPKQLQASRQAQPSRTPPKPIAKKPVTRAPITSGAYSKSARAYAVQSAADAMSDHKSASHARAAADLSSLRGALHSQKSLRQFVAMAEVLGSPRSVAPWQSVG
jgi:hypothetical protein